MSRLDDLNIFFHLRRKRKSVVLEEDEELIYRALKRKFEAINRGRRKGRPVSYEP